MNILFAILLALIIDDTLIMRPRPLMPVRNQELMAEVQSFMDFVDRYHLPPVSLDKITLIEYTSELDVEGDGMVLGRCTVYGFPLYQMSISIHPRLTGLKLKAVLYHELTHGLYDLDHSETGLMAAIFPYDDYELEAFWEDIEAELAEYIRSQVP